jgi:hypothetical protein
LQSSVNGKLGADGNLKPILELRTTYDEQYGSSDEPRATPALKPDGHNLHDGRTRRGRTCVHQIGIRAYLDIGRYGRSMRCQHCHRPMTQSIHVDQADPNDHGDDDGDGKHRG